MKKLLVVLVSIASCLSASADTGSIAAGETTATFTNSGPHSLVHISNVAVNCATAANDTFLILVTKGGVDYQVATISATTNSVYGNVIVTNPIPISSDGVFKVSRGVTNYAASVYIDVK